MENDLKYFNGKEYLAIRKVRHNEKVYTIYFDTQTQTNVLIGNDFGDVLEDKLIIKEIMDANFLKASNILTSNLDEQDKDFEDEMEETEQNVDEPYSRKNTELILKKIKKMFFNKFGMDVLTNEQLDERLQAIKGICLSRKLRSGEESVGEWDSEECIIRILSDNLDTTRTNYQVVFHEIIHAITFLNGYNGTKKCISVDDDMHEYGRGVNEGIVSYIENMKKSKKWQEFEHTGSYDQQRRIISQIATLYDNMNLGGEHNFIELYIIDPANTLGRINEIFEEKHRKENPNLTDRQYALNSMRESFNFILNLDDMILAKESEEREQLLAECESVLVDLYISQIRNTKIKSLEHLYEILYNIEGFNSNLTKRSLEIGFLIEAKIREYQAENSNVTLSDIIESLPAQVSTSQEIGPEEKLLMAIFGEQISDPRYDVIKEAVEQIQPIETNNKGIRTTKSQIGRAFGISVPVEKKDEVESHMKKEIQKNDEKSNGGKVND